MRSAACFALLALACASAPSPRARTPRVVAPIEAPAEPPAPREVRPPSDAELGGERIAEHHARVDEEARVHIVLREGECYRAWIGGEGSFTARLVDEHEHTIASAESDGALWLGDPAICPRWSGSFTLVVEAPLQMDAHIVLVRAD